ncbi:MULTISPECIES: hypothetical protein [unclassified Brevundimonas]|uniref:hypothetical protein n=1 Tax=unclassified Brevundimonas TaxID=2622653 RepID=UPI0006FE34A2|nr:MULTISPECIES: hypothetical protein [unclassified Brevundimonas]KQY95613.1 hypothetical protein ASD25_16540 [Brevundimonas sp. Root1423]KRA29262.1 hypothetical protein ASD59_05645 [Brevundimonas sp. Root608]
MTYVEIGRLILFLVPVYAIAFFLFPSHLASYFERDGLPSHEIVRQFRVLERRRLWIGAGGFGACLLLLPLHGSHVTFMVTMIAGLAALWVADAFQFCSISRDHRNVA